MTNIFISSRFRQLDRKKKKKKENIPAYTIPTVYLSVYIIMYIKKRKKKNLRRIFFPFKSEDIVLNKYSTNDVYIGVCAFRKCVPTPRGKKAYFRTHVTTDINLRWFPPPPPLRILFFYSQPAFSLSRIFFLYIRVINVNMRVTLLR